jgi:hypothetical protein
MLPMIICGWRVSTRKLGGNCSMCQPRIVPKCERLQYLLVPIVLTHDMVNETHWSLFRSSSAGEG